MCLIRLSSHSAVSRFWRMILLVFFLFSTCGSGLGKTERKVKRMVVSKVTKKVNAKNTIVTIRASVSGRLLLVKLDRKEEQIIVLNSTLKKPDNLVGKDDLVLHDLFVDNQWTGTRGDGLKDLQICRFDLVVTILKAGDNRAAIVESNNFNNVLKGLEVELFQNK